jgi:hypothetical protein
MADFRKLLLALIAGALMFGTVAGAADFSCQVAGVPTLVRSEGVADYVGDVLMNCSGTLPPLDAANGVTANIRLSFLGQGVIITSKVLDPSVTRKVSEATLVIDNAIAPDCIVAGPCLTPSNLPMAGQRHPKGYLSTSSILSPFLDGSQNIYQAIQLNDQELEWQGVVIIGPNSGQTTRSIRLTNVRVNAQGLAVNAPINAQVNITSPTSIPIFGNASVLVANIRQGLIVGHSGLTFKNCDLQPNGTVTFTTTFTEGFGTAFKPRYNNLLGSTGHFVPGGGYFDESGYNPVGFVGGAAGQIMGGVLDAGSSLVALSQIGNATQGTQFGITVTGVPTGVTLAFGTITATNGMTVTAVGTPTVTGSTVVLTAEVTGFTLAAAETLVDVVTIPVIGTYGAPPVVGIATAHGRFLPNASPNFTAQTEIVAPVPRFVDSTSATDAAVVTITQSCKTLLLFPYLTSSAGYNSGIAITNTSLDPLGSVLTTGEIGYAPTAYGVTKPQAGACTLWFYGQAGAAPLGLLNINQTTISIPAGGQFITNLSAGVGGGFVYGVDGSKTAACDTSVNASCPGFSGYVGYMIAACNFQWAHGFAFVTDTGSDRTMGYLALVIPDRGTGGRLAQDESLGAGANQGEQLNQ